MTGEGKLLENWIVGDFNAESPTHQATNRAIAHSAAAIKTVIEPVWMPTAAIVEKSGESLEHYAGLWIAPGIPDSMDGVLRVITYARENNIPLLGTCGGFQSIIMEFARNVLGIVDAHHEEYDPGADRIVISKLSCSLVGQEGQILIKQPSVVHSIYQSENAVEAFRCSYGLNASYTECLNEAGLYIVGTDINGEPRIVEIPSLSFFVGTLYVPQLHSAFNGSHCLIDAFLTKAAQR